MQITFQKRLQALAENSLNKSLMRQRHGRHPWSERTFVSSQMKKFPDSLYLKLRFSMIGIFSELIRTQEPTVGSPRVAAHKLKLVHKIVALLPRFVYTCYYLSSHPNTLQSAFICVVEFSIYMMMTTKLTREASIKWARNWFLFTPRTPRLDNFFRISKRRANLFTVKIFAWARQNTRRSTRRKSFWLRRHRVTYRPHNCCLPMKYCNETKERRFE